MRLPEPQRHIPDMGELHLIPSRQADHRGKLRDPVSDERQGFTEPLGRTRFREELVSRLERGIGSR